MKSDGRDNGTVSRVAQLVRAASGEEWSRKLWRAPSEGRAQVRALSWLQINHFKY